MSTCLPASPACATRFHSTDVAVPTFWSSTCVQPAGGVDTSCSELLKVSTMIRPSPGCTDSGIRA